MDPHPSNTRQGTGGELSNTRVAKDIEQSMCAEVAQLRSENARLLNLVQKLSEVKDFEALRDSVLSCLKLGSQAPRYKMVKSTLDQFMKLRRDSVEKATDVVSS